MAEGRGAGGTLQTCHVPLIRRQEHGQAGPARQVGTRHLPSSEEFKWL